MRSSILRNDRPVPARPMWAVRGLSYEPGGIIYSLDPGDPELVFVKKFVTPTGLEQKVEVE